MRGLSRNTLHCFMLIWLAAALSLLLLCSDCAGVITEIPLANPAFTEGVQANGVPVGWSLYGLLSRNLSVKVVDLPQGTRGVLIEDNDPTAEIGLLQTVPIKPGVTYGVRVQLRGVPNSTAAGAHVQVRFLPSHQLYQTSLAAEDSDRFGEVMVKGTAPPDTTHATIYLYTHREPTPKVLIKSVCLVAGVEPPETPPPPPIPPVYTRLKDLHLTTHLIRDGKANVNIVIPASGTYRADAQRLQQAIRRLTHVTIPIVTDTSPAAAVPIVSNLIVLGNRSTNHTMSELYNRYFLLTDLKYPGSGGYELRSLHNPFGNGFNVIIAGASDARAVADAVNVLIAKMQRMDGKGALSVGWLMEIRLGKGIAVPKDLRSFETWDDSRGYGSVGYFGWNSISKRMAMYYMTGDPFHAREALRLAFPDQQAFREICEIDGERIENKDDPLAGPYHYNAHLMILFWDLIEESPEFSDEERLKVTNAFSRQLNHRKNEGVYGLTQPPAAVGSRHGQWSAVSLYCLGRYFQRDYPDPIWDQCVRGALLHFAPLHEDANVGGESDNLYWYSTGIAPIFTHLLLTGDRKPLHNGVLGELLRGQEVLISGRQPDWALNYAALDYLHKAAHLTQDGRWLTYRDRTGLNTGVFRLGQSYWPEATCQPKLPIDLVGRWTVHPLTKSQWRARGSGLPFEQSFHNASFRSAPDASGDFVLLDGFNGASRNPYHTFAILELRINGFTVLQGYHNQVLTKADGMVEPQVAMDGALKYQDVLGETTIAVGEVPKAAFCNWRRTLMQRVGRYALLVDDLTFRTDSDNIEVETSWENAYGTFTANPTDGSLSLQSSRPAALPPGWKRFRSLDAKCTTNLSETDAIVRLDSLNITLLRAKEAGAWLEMPFELREGVRGEVFADFLNYTDRGVVAISIDGKRLGGRYDNHATSVVTGKANLGTLDLSAGRHRLRVEVVERHAGVERCNVGLEGLTIRPEGAPPAPQGYVAEIRWCDVPDFVRSGSMATWEWRGSAKKGKCKTFFSLIGIRPNTLDKPLQCLRLADNAAVLLLPEPAVAVAGEFEEIKAELAIIAETGIHAKHLTAGRVLTSTRPICVDWDFRTGIAHVTTSTSTTMQFPLERSGVLVNGKPWNDWPQYGLATFRLPPGGHEFKNLKLAQPALASLRKVLTESLARAESLRTQRNSAEKRPVTSNVPDISVLWQMRVPGPVTDCAIISSPERTSLAIAQGKTIHLLTSDGQEVRKMETDGSIRVLRWWPEHRLLLAGCVDEKVIAFNLAGNRRWVFVSEMDPAVFRAAKTYWFKTAPGHEGIHGLHSGVFLDGKSQAFVGSACTLEVIDENGKLLKRMPQFWGTVYKFAIVPGPGDSLNLLASRKITDNASVAVINNRTLDPTPRSFHGVPYGHTYVGGWMSETRHHIFVEDLDGDATPEVISEITGAWNRISIWDLAGNPEYSASFGPGAFAPARNISDICIGDIQADGKKEIIAALSSGLVVVLDHQCKKVWAKRLASPGTVIGFLAGSIVVGSKDGSVTTLSNDGTVLRVGKVTGAPTCIEAWGNTVLLATDAGKVTRFAAGT